MRGSDESLFHDAASKRLVGYIAKCLRTVSTIQLIWVSISPTPYTLKINIGVKQWQALAAASPAGVLIKLVRYNGTFS